MTRARPPPPSFPSWSALACLLALAAATSCGAQGSPPAAEQAPAAGGAAVLQVSPAAGPPPLQVANPPAAEQAFAPVEAVAQPPAAEFPGAAQQGGEAAAGEAFPLEPPPSPAEGGDIFAEGLPPAPASGQEQQQAGQGTPPPLDAGQTLPPGVLPADAQAVLGPGDAGSGSGDAGGSVLPGVPPGAAAAQATDPSQRVGQLISLLAPPPGFVPPPLSAEAQALAPKLKQLRQGTATVTYQRQVGPLDARNFACGVAYLNEYFQGHFVALPLPLFQSGQLCQACVRMWCVDSVCSDPLTSSALFMVVDSCKECGPTDLVASAPGLTNLTGGVSVDRTPKLQVAWTFASCAPLIDGGIRMWPSEKTAAEYLGLQFSNLKSLLKGVAINGILMQKTSFGYWTIDTPGKPIPLRPPYTLVLLSAQNERISTTVPNLRPQDLGINFSRDSGGSSGGGGSAGSGGSGGSGGSKAASPAAAPAPAVAASGGAGP